MRLPESGSRTRREFMKDITLGSVAAVAAARAFGAAAGEAQAQGTVAPNWKSQIGLELYTVRDLMASDFEGVLAKVAAIGYKEVEPAGGYNNMEPKAFKAMLDRYGLTMPSTHSGARGEGIELEKQLEGFQIMGLKYADVAGPPAARGSGAGAARGRGPATPLPPGAYYDAGTGITHNSFKETEAFGPYQPQTTLDVVKRRAAQLNTNGKLLQKFGMKTFVHNHTGEFEKLLDSPKTTYDVLLEETDPSLVAMQMDVGWVYMAGVDPIALIKAHPGRFELWHVKDVFGLKTVNPTLSPNRRVSSMAIAAVGSGQIDYKMVFTHAAEAGLKHFCVEQDNAAAWGDSLAAARISYKSLSEMLS